MSIHDKISKEELRNKLILLKPETNIDNHIKIVIIGLKTLNIKLYAKHKENYSGEIYYDKNIDIDNINDILNEKYGFTIKDFKKYGLVLCEILDKDSYKIDAII